MDGGKGYITKDEYLKMMTGGQADKAEFFIIMFDAMDVNKNGKVIPVVVY